MVKRPAFRKYAGYFTAFMIKRPVLIDGIYYTFKDYPMLLMGNILIVAAMPFVYAYSPITPDPYGSEAITFAVTLGITLSVVYWLFFAYFSGRFQDDSIQKAASKVPYLDYGDGQETKEKKDKPTRQERIEAWKSRGAFAAFVILFCLLVTLYCTVLYTPIYARIYNGHQQDLKRLTEIAAKYDRFHVAQDKGSSLYINGYTNTPAGEIPLSQQDEQELARIFINFQKESVMEILLYGPGDHALQNKMLILRQYDLRDMVWYSENLTSDEVADDEGVLVQNVIRIDEQWWWAD